MTGGMVLQGREVREADIGLIRGLLAEHPEWGRTRIKDVYLYPLVKDFRRELCA